MAFTGFLPGDLDCYLPERQSSNSWNRQRLEVKERAMALGVELQARLAAAGLLLSLEASDANPSVWNKRRVDAQWVFFWRSPDERAALQAIVDHEKKLADSILDPTPYQKHIFLCVRVHHAGVEMGLRLHRDAWVDHQNLRTRCASEEGLAEVVAILRALPESFRVAAPGAVEIPAREVDVAGLDAILGAFGETSEWIAVSETADLAQVVGLGDGLVARAAEALAALVPLYRHVAWSRDNDWTRIDDALAAQAAGRQAARLALETERKAREAERLEESKAAAERTREKTRDTALARAHAAFGAGRKPTPKPTPKVDAKPVERPEPRPSARPAAPPAKRPEPKPRRPEPKRPEPKPAAKRPSARPEPALDVAPGAIVKGARVRITGGPFSGKVGTVAEVDGRGQVKVLLGLLMARVEASQVSPLGRG